MFGGHQVFRQTRARVDDERATAELATRQRVPSSSQGVMASWTAAPIGGAGEQVLLIGVDALRVTGTSTETIGPPRMFQLGLRYASAR